MFPFHLHNLVCTSLIIQTVGKTFNNHGLEMEGGRHVTSHVTSHVTCHVSCEVSCDVNVSIFVDIGRSSIRK